MPVASISEREQGDLHSVASDMGLLRIQSVETAGLSVAQMVIGILGGARRINPRNALQAPEVLVLVGDSDVCAEAVCLARHLLNHHVKPLLYLTAQTLPTLSAEGFAQYKLYLNSGGTLIETANALPSTAIDLIVDAIGPPKLSTSSAAAVAWCATKKASVLSLEHPGGVDPETGANAGPSIKATRCVSFGLPKEGAGFAESCQQLFLADNGLPLPAYAELGIEYHNPFHDKMVLPLEPNE